MTCIRLELELKNVSGFYAVIGLNIILIILDIQFKSLNDRNKVVVSINIVDRGEHVPIIERNHRVLEDQGHCNYSMLPFDYLLR